MHRGMRMTLKNLGGGVENPVICVWVCPRPEFVKTLCKNIFLFLTVHQVQTSPPWQYSSFKPSLPQRTSAWKQNTPGTEGWKPHTLPLLLMCALMNVTHASHIAHFSPWPLLPAQLKSGSLPHSHCQLKYPARSQTGNKTKYHGMWSTSLVPPISYEEYGSFRSVYDNTEA